MTAADEGLARAVARRYLASEARVTRRVIDRRALADAAITEAPDHLDPDGFDALLDAASAEIRASKAAHAWPDETGTVAALEERIARAAGEAEGWLSVLNVAANAPSVQGTESLQVLTGTAGAMRKILAILQGTEPAEPPSASDAHGCSGCGRGFSTIPSASDPLRRYANTAFCHGCVSNCHEGGDGHRCRFCTPPRAHAAAAPPAAWNASRASADESAAPAPTDTTVKEGL